MSPCSLW